MDLNKPISIVITEYGLVKALKTMGHSSLMRSRRYDVVSHEGCDG